MAESGSEVRRIVWSEAFPFVRLFRALALALDFNRLVLGVMCVLAVYFGGRIFDRVWLMLSSGAEVRAQGGHVVTELDVYAGGNQAAYNEWVRQAREARQQVAIDALLERNAGQTREEAQRKLAEKGWNLDASIRDEAFEKDRSWARQFVDESLAAGHKQVDGEASLSGAERDERRGALVGAADALRRVLRGHSSAGALGDPELATAERTVLQAASAGKDSQVDARQRLARVVSTQMTLIRYRQGQPWGPFAALLHHEMRCFAAAIDGVCGGRWGASGRVDDAQPSLFGSLISAWRGVAWLGVNRTCYFGLYGLFALLVTALFGGAICRSAAVQAARDESLSIGKALGFAREKYGGLLMAPLLPALAFVFVAICLFAGGLIGAVPYLGELFAGVFYVLALLGGFVAAILLLATILGFNLMWPTIAAEGSDGFDALSRACSYVGSRIFHYGFYAFVLLIYGGLSFVLVRVVAMLGLKLTHTLTGFGMNFASNGALDGVDKLPGLWSMPAWADLSLLPSTGDVPFWGRLFAAPLDYTEWLGCLLIAIWVYLVVALVGSFVVNFYFCGSVQMYYLLRRDVDATDYEEIYYEDPEEDLNDVPGEAAAPASGTGAPPPGEVGAPPD